MRTFDHFHARYWRRGRRLLCVLAALGLQTCDVQASTWGIGAVAGTQPALSLYYHPASDHAYHLMAHYSETRVAFSTDVQRRYTPYFGYGDRWRLAFYAGFGVEGQSQRYGDGVESYNLRLPIGLQWDVSAAAVALFGEVAGKVGPLPKTQQSAMAAAGMRAMF